MSTWKMLSFQDSNSPYFDSLISFHNLTLMLMLIIISTTMFILIDIFLNKFNNRYLLKNHLLETIWTFLPMIFLIFICIPSLKILYFIDEISNPMFSIKAIGHQWYWTYEYADFLNFEFDSYMLTEYNKSNFRLLDVDNRMLVPYNYIIRLMTSSMDVIHSWTVPSLGIKIDSIPGRINQMNFLTMRPGLFFGQCSEICGTNHSFMPIVIESTNLFNFIYWVLKML